MAVKKITKRSEAKYPALDPLLNLKTRFDNLDYDYLDQLNPKELQYLNDFTNEYTNVVFDKTKKRTMKKKKTESDKNVHLRELNKKMVLIVENIQDLINKTNINYTSKVRLKKIITKMKTTFRKQIKKELVYIDDTYKKDAYDRNNSRNRCVLTRARAHGKALGIDEISEDHTDNENVEDQMIAALDAMKELKNSKND
jgi:hypothetical protein